MLRSVFVIGLMAACHPAPAPTVVHPPPPAVATPLAQTAPVRQDFELTVDVAPGPLHEVLATGHGPCDSQPPRGPILFVANQVAPCKKLGVRPRM